MLGTGLLPRSGSDMPPTGMQTPRQNIGIIGFGNQARAWAQNLHDQGWEVSILLRENSDSHAIARAQDFRTLPLQAMKQFSTLAILIPDDAMPSLAKECQSYLQHKPCLVFAHGFNLHYQKEIWPETCELLLLAPKGIASAVRERFLAGSGVPCVISYERKHSNAIETIANMLAADLGFQQGGMYFGSAKEEVIADLFSEQTLLTGGVPALVQASIDIMIKAGISPEIAYLECVHELAFLCSLFQEKGIHQTLLGASPTAQYGGKIGGETLVDDAMKKKLQNIMRRIQSGEFRKKLQSESTSNYSQTRAYLESLQNHISQKAGERVRQTISVKEKA